MSRAALTVRAMFALPERDTIPDDPPDPADAALAIDAALHPRRIALITGHSGSGKSRLADAIARRCAAAGRPVIHERGLTPQTHSDPHARVIDALTGPIERRLRALARAGLAEARLFLRPVASLSVGERARLTLARAFLIAESSPTPATLILDEFASTLDRDTAARVGTLLRRWVDRAPAPVRVLCLTGHEDLDGPLRPDLRRRLGPRGPAHAAPPRIEIGNPADYRALAHLHDRRRTARHAGPRAVRRAIHPDSGELMGVLLVAMPVLNLAARAVAWPGRYNARPHTLAARRLARELRTIARVIVAPRHRALGVGVALVRHYLADPLTPATEALAAMGRACPIFSAAGMTPVPTPPTPRTARLIDALHHMRIRPEELLAARARADGPAPMHPLLEREVRRWAAASRATRALLDRPQELRAAMLRAVLAPPLYHAHAAPAARKEGSRAAA